MASTAGTGGGSAVGGAVESGSDGDGVAESGSDEDGVAANECCTLPATGDPLRTGGGRSPIPGPLVYQSSKPGATTPIAGMARGPATSWKSVAAGFSWSPEADDGRPTSAAGSTVVCVIASSDARLSAAAPAPSTEDAREERCGAVCLPMGPLCLPERGSLHPGRVIESWTTDTTMRGSRSWPDGRRRGVHSPDPGRAMTRCHRR